MTVTACLCGKVCPSGRCRRKDAGEGCGRGIAAACVAKRPIQPSWYLYKCFSLKYPIFAELLNAAKQCPPLAMVLLPQGCIFGLL